MKVQHRTAVIAVMLVAVMSTWTVTLGAVVNGHVGTTLMGAVLTVVLIVAMALLP